MEEFRKLLMTKWYKVLLARKLPWLHHKTLVRSCHETSLAVNCEIYENENAIFKYNSPRSDVTYDAYDAENCRDVRERSPRVVPTTDRYIK